MTRPASGAMPPVPGRAMQGTGQSTSQLVKAPIPVNRWVRNGKHPNAVYESMKSEAVNQAALYRTKQYFSALGCFNNPQTGGAGAGDRVRWRFAFHSGPYAQYAQALVVNQDPNTGGTLSSYGRLDLTDVNGTVLVSDTFHWGMQQGGLTGIDALQPIWKQLPIQPDTDYYGVLTDVDDNVMLTACVYEIASMNQAGGYMPQNFVSGGPIYDQQRANLAQATEKLWKRSGASVLIWTADTENVYGPYGTTSTTPVPISSFSVGSPYLLDMSGKARLSQFSTGVPVKMAVYAGVSAFSTTGVVGLYDIGGNKIIECPITSWPAAGWQVVSGVLPPTLFNANLMFRAVGSTTVTVSAVSIYEYDP